MDSFYDPKKKSPLRNELHSVHHEAGFQVLLFL